MRIEPDMVIRKRKGDTMLHICAELGQARIFKMLVESGHNMGVLNQVSEQ